jgi:hypothetical protein
VMGPEDCWGSSGSSTSRPRNRTTLRPDPRRHRP